MGEVYTVPLFVGDAALLVGDAALLVGDAALLVGGCTTACVMQMHKHTIAQTNSF